MFGLAHLLELPLDLPLVFLFGFLELALQLLQSVLLFEVSDLQVLVPLVFLKELLHLLRGFGLSVLDVEQLAQLDVVLACAFEPFLELLDGLLLLLDLVLLLSVLDVSA